MTDEELMGEEGLEDTPVATDEIPEEIDEDLDGFDELTDEDEGEELTDEELAAIEEDVATMMTGFQTEDEEVSQPLHYADELDIIGQYEVQIHEANKQIAKIEAALKAKKSSIQFDVEKEWKEKKTDMLSNEKLRQIESDKRIARDVECNELNEALDELDNGVKYNDIYKRNEERAFQVIIASANINI